MSNKKPVRRSARSPRRGPGPGGPLAIIFGGLILLGVAAFAYMSLGNGAGVEVEVTGRPRLKADKEKVDLGDIPLGQTVEVSFELANVGDKQLRFTEPPYVEVVEGC